jgi:putative intracellular protease/amidase
MKTFVFLHEPYADWEIGYILPQLRRNKKEVHIFGLTKNTITSGGGLCVTPELAMNEVRISRGDLLILCGGWFWADFVNPEFDELVRAAHKNGAVVAGICAASAYLGQIGLLDNVQHTSNSLEFLRQRAPQYTGKELYKNQLAVFDKDILTASGIGAVEFTYELLKRFAIFGEKDCLDWYRAFKFGEEPKS